MTIKNTARKSFASNVAPTLAAASEPTVNLVIGGKNVTMKLSDFLAATNAATAPASQPTAVKAPAPVVSLPVTKSEGPKVSKSAAFTAHAVQVTGKPEADVKSAMTAAHKAASKGDWSPEGREAFKKAYNKALKASLGITRY